METKKLLEEVDAVVGETPFALRLEAAKLLITAARELSNPPSDNEVSVLLNAAHYYASTTLLGASIEREKD